MKKIYLLIISLFMIYGCAEKSISNNSNMLTGKSFYLLSNENISINFDNEKVYGFSGVNNFMGFYKVAGNKILFIDIVTTMMAGLEKDMNFELKFIESLITSKGFSLNNGKLTIGNDLIFIQK